jgi:hypothetical protein
MKESEGQWKTYFQGYGNPTTADNAFEFWNSSLTAIFWINDNGLIKQPVNFIQLHVQELIQLHIQEVSMLIHPTVQMVNILCISCMELLVGFTVCLQKMRNMIKKILKNSKMNM